VSFYRSVLGPILFEFDAEFAHGLAIAALKLKRPVRIINDDPALRSELWGLTFPNPVGMAAGFDKNADVVDGLLGLGFGFVETGTVTPRPQSGNPKPRLFRLVEDEGVINRLGFNGAGLERARARLAARSGRSGIVGANVGKNRDSTDEVADYVKGIEVLAPLAQYLVVNVSSPNTPGLRDLQRKDRLTELLSAVVSARNAAAERRPPLLVKVAPDLDDIQIADIADAALVTGIDGLIATNTTIGRPDSLRAPAKGETGGLSGKPLFGLATRILSEFYKATGGKLPLIGVGGILSGADAYAKIKAGASLVQIYSGMVYRGPGLVEEIKRDLLLRLKADGFRSVGEAVGAAHR
jgi:dihydroorotate dehydrogenase